MAQLIGYDVFRALKACRSIEQTNCTILAGLSTLQRDADQTRKCLEIAGHRLEESLGHFAIAQARLREVNLQHDRVMRAVEAIMATSPAFQSLR
ncbi:MAG: hypothetical protein WCZ23_04380 [Rhodospirillaceae bacterium]